MPLTYDPPVRVCNLQTAGEAGPGGRRRRVAWRSLLQGCRHIPTCTLEPPALPAAAGRSGQVAGSTLEASAGVDSITVFLHQVRALSDIAWPHAVAVGRRPRRLT
ncbi:unnamed protein product [Chrysodeixis includens]|uniref:Uncharacterized protein n=1 Tax=Chrysodeixis includens TaxID=689277 RepID=A0A9N8L4R6_CHRIL|nr:unnamed protein product [Chrysodeixis includens]